MIDVGFKLTASDTKKLDEFKNSAAYSTYLKAITASPIYFTIVREYIKNIDIKYDLNKLQNDGSLPDNLSLEAINVLFKQSISRMAINIMADTVILVELEKKRVDDVIYDIKSDSDIIYLLGTAEEKYYKEAEKLLEEGKLDKDSVAYRGLVNWLKIKEKLPKNKTEQSIYPTLKKIDKVNTINKTINKINLDSLDIEI